MTDIAERMRLRGLGPRGVTITAEGGFITTGDAECREASEEIQRLRRSAANGWQGVAEARQRAMDKLRTDLNEAQAALAVHRNAAESAKRASYPHEQGQADVVSGVTLNKRDDEMRSRVPHVRALLGETNRTMSALNAALYDIERYL